MKKYSLFFLIVLAVFAAACGKKGDPLPQKIDQVFSLQNVFMTYNPEGTLTVQGSVVGSLESVQAFLLEIEAVDENCIGCPFIPAEKYAKTPNEVWGDGRKKDFSFTVFPHTQSGAYRWRLVVHNSVSGLPNAVTPVYKVLKPIEDSRDFMEIK